MEISNLPRERETEDRLFFILFKELIRDEGWNFFYIQSNFKNIVYFGKEETIDELKTNGCVVESVGYLFKTACKALITQKEIYKNTPK